MSALPQRTRILIKDLLFQEKYKLNNTQVDIMSYIFNSLTWAIKVDGFLVITNKKLISDMPQITQKTLESSLRALKAVELIETDMVSVSQWNGAKVRGIKITEKGMEYNSSLYMPTAKTLLESLEEELAIQRKELENRQKRIDQLEERLKNADIKEFQESKEVENSKEIEEKKENSSKAKDEQEPELIEIEGFREFIETIKKEYQVTAEPICNMVKGWQKETEFYINSYNKLAIVTPDGEYKQIGNPQDINKFWKWLYINQQRVGDVIDFRKEPTIKDLNRRYVGKMLDVSSGVREIYKIEEADNAMVKITIKDENGKIGTIAENGKPVTFKPRDCEDVLFRMVKD